MVDLQSQKECGKVWAVESHRIFQSMIVPYRAYQYGQRPGFDCGTDAELLIVPLQN
jgi:hypothetical protein